MTEQLFDLPIEINPLEPEITLTAIKNVTVNEPYFNGHFPQNPIMPGVLIIEAMAQACGLLANVALATSQRDATKYYLVKIDKAKFNRKVVPGDQLVMEVKQTRLMRGLGKYECRATVNGERTASCEVLCSEG